MELNEFLEKFLPEYEDEKRFAEIRIRRLCAGISRVDLKDLVCKYLSETYFSKALQNFANKLCEKQKEKVSDCFKKFPAISLGILEVEQPTIEELCD